MVTFNKPATALSAGASEWRGIDRTRRLDRTAARKGTSRTMGSGSTPRTSASGKLLIGSFAAATTTGVRAGPGFRTLTTQLRAQVQGGAVTQFQEYRLGAARGAHDASALSALAVPYAGAVAAYRGAASSTALAVGPARPTNLSASSKTVTSITVSWKASSSKGVEGYGLYLNGSRVDTVTGTTGRSPTSPAARPTRSRSTRSTLPAGARPRPRSARARMTAPTHRASRSRLRPTGRP